MVAPVDTLVAEVWAARHGVETGASLRFAALSQRMQAAGAPATLVELAARASSDEHRHAAHCADILRQRQAKVPPPETELRVYAPTGLSAEQSLAYEVVAQCCISETESMATLVTLLDAASDAHLRKVLQELARDEVQHARLGWAYLSWARNRLDLAFLAPWLPGMAAGTAGPQMFEPGPPEAEDPLLLRSGVVPQSQRRRVYLETLDSVVIPGFEEFGVDVEPLRRWTEDRRAAPSGRAEGR